MTVIGARTTRSFLLAFCFSLVSQAAPSDLLSTASPKLKQFLARNPAASNSLADIVTTQQSARNYTLFYFYGTNTLIPRAAHKYLGNNTVAITVREDQEPIDEFICLTFELLNSSNESKFEQIAKDARKNNLSRTDFAKKIAETEFIATKELKALLPRMKLEQTDISSSYFYTNLLTAPDTFDKFFAGITNRSSGRDYIKSYESDYDLYFQKPDAGGFAQRSYELAQRGYELAQQGNLDGAETNYLAAVKLDPTDVSSYCCLGKIYTEKGDYVKGLEYLNHSIQLDSNNAIAYETRAWAYGSQRNYSKAAADYRAAININANNPRLHANLAWAYVSMKDTTNALAEYQKALDLDPQSVKTLVDQGNAFMLLENWDRANRNFAAALRIAPNDRDVITSLAWLRATCPVAAIRDGKSAVELATKVCQFTQWNDYQKLETLAAGYAEEANFDDAVKYQEKALALAAKTSSLTAESQHRLELYKSHKPFHWSPKTSDY